MKVPALIAALAVAAAAVFLLLDRDEDHPAPGGSTAPYRGVLGAVGASLPLPDVRLKPAPDPVRGPSFPIAIVRPGQRVELRASPGGKVIAPAADRTAFGSIRVF